MNGTTLSSIKGTSTLVRPKFGPGMLLQADDLDSLTTYTRELNRLMFRSLFGCGVVCGLVVKPDKDKCERLTLAIGAGLALGCGGDPIYVPKDQSLTVGDCEAHELPKPPLWVLLCATSKCCAPRAASCGCDDDTPQSNPTRVRDCFEIRVVSQLPKCLCYCPPPEETKQGDEGGFQEAAGVAIRGAAREESDCRCGPTTGCYEDHYKGNCACCDDCTDGSCDCNCVLLAQLVTEKNDKGVDVWKANHCYRRFVRPILMRDPACPKKAVTMTGELMEKDIGEEIVVERRTRRAKIKV